MSVDKRIKTIIAVIMFFLVGTLSGCAKRQINSCVDIGYEYGNWIEYGSGTATTDNQTIMSFRGDIIENEYSASITAEVTEYIKAEIGYVLSTSSIEATGTSQTINKGESICFYYRPVYKIFEVTYDDEKNRPQPVKELVSPEYAYEISDSEGRIITDTRIIKPEFIKEVDQIDSDSEFYNNHPDNPHIPDDFFRSIPLDVNQQKEFLNKYNLELESGDYGDRLYDSCIIYFSPITYLSCRYLVDEPSTYYEINVSYRKEYTDTIKNILHDLYDLKIPKKPSHSMNSEGNPYYYLYAMDIDRIIEFSYCDGNEGNTHLYIYDLVYFKDKNPEKYQELFEPKKPNFLERIFNID